MTFGFILSRHINSEKTNRYWNHCIKLLRTFYPHKQIVVIDDNSNKQYVKPDHEYKNITYIQSEYNGRGELLPYIYYLRNKWFDKAVIIHDSIFFHMRIPFETINTPVIPLWHFDYDKENVYNLTRISSYIKNNLQLNNYLLSQETNVMGLSSKIKSCFGVMSYIDHNFLRYIEHKYNITNLIKAVHVRQDRCALERILGGIFWLENPDLKKKPSIFGNIHKFPNSFHYNYDTYYKQLMNKEKIKPVVKVWTGR